jgi:hypothetical protein
MVIVTSPIGWESFWTDHANGTSILYRCRDPQSTEIKLDQCLKAGVCRSARRICCLATRAGSHPRVLASAQGAIVLSAAVLPLNGKNIEAQVI